MGLGLSTGSSGNDYLPIVTWDARAGRMFRIDREQGGDGMWASNKVDITNEQPTFLADFGSIEVGFLAFTPTGPSFALAPLGQPFPAKPTPEHKQGARMKLFSPKNFGGAGIREFAASAKSVLSAIDALHSQFESAPEAAEGKLPIVKLTGSTSITTKGPSGNVTSYSPTLTITGWAPRPAELGERTVPVPGTKAAAPAAAPAPKPTAHVPPPTTKAPAMAGGVSMVDDEMPFAPEWR